MDERLVTAAAIGDGLIRASDARELGVHPSAIQRYEQDGSLVRVRTGVYAMRDEWQKLRADERHRRLIVATVGAARHPLVVSHRSAAALHRLPLLGAVPAVVDITQAGRGGGRRTAHVSLHRSGPEPAVETIDGVVCTSLPRTLVDIAISRPLVQSVPMLDAALARPGITRPLLDAELDHVDPTRGRAMAARAIAFADKRSDSPGESVSRVRIRELGFAAPELQVRFDGIRGSFALVDFYWRGIRLIGEFDGRLKYLRSRDVSGLDPAQVLYEEKLREDALRRLGERLVRWDWSTAWAPRELHRLLSEFGVPRQR
ncbi:type IV toxin-antitoxin system AbiEi family antitoxin domain-containing protein [Agromyces sp. NPDC058136]|uniref:type IV toxin-antitoxin system AbiEi family antitoxin domain-containing protein n=1 Tax=Agromyces sp. NPDC058136 TaxID=3346354 RepID=UPI0036DF5956